MISLPHLVVNCDRCTRSINFVGWLDLVDVMQRLDEQGWIVRSVHTDTPSSMCPDCFNAKCRTNRLESTSR